MKRLAAVMVAASLSLFGCSGVSGDEADTEKWTAVLVDALETVDNVEEMADVSYSPQGVFTTDQVWLNGKLMVNSDDTAVVQKVLDDAGRAIAEAFAENTVEKSWVRISAITASNKRVNIQDVIGEDNTVTLDTLAEHYGIPRR